MIFLLIRSAALVAFFVLSTVRKLSFRVCRRRELESTVPDAKTARRTTARLGTANFVAPSLSDAVTLSLRSVAANARLHRNAAARFDVTYSARPIGEHVSTGRTRREHPILRCQGIATHFATATQTVATTGRGHCLRVRRHIASVTNSRRNH